MFSFIVIAGDPVNPLSLHKSVVLTKKVADKLFGDSINNYGEIIGEGIKFPEKPPNEYSVTAVIEDPPENNSFRWSLLVPFDNARAYPECNDFIGNSSVYVMLDEQNDAEKLEETAQSLLPEFHGEGLQQVIHAGFLS